MRLYRILIRNRWWIICAAVTLILFRLICSYHKSSLQRTLSDYLSQHVEAENGLAGKYFNNPIWEGDHINFTEKLPIAFHHDSPRLRGDNFSLKYKGVLKAPIDGEYCFVVSSDDGAWIYLNKYLILDNGGIHPVVKKKRYIYLREGLHLFELDYFQKEGDAQLHLLWRIPGMHRALINNKYMFLVSESFSEGQFNSLKDKYKWFKLIELFLLTVFVIIICFFVGLKVNLTYMVKTPLRFQRFFLKYSYVWLTIIGIVSIISSRTVWNIDYWPYFCIIHVICLYLILIFIYAVLINGNRYWGIRDVIIFSFIYIFGYIYFFLHSPIPNLNHDVLFYFNEGERFLYGDFNRMHYPLLVYILFGICYKFSLGDFSNFFIIFSAIRFLFLIGLFYYLYKFSKSIQKPIYGFIFSIFLLLTPFNANWVVARYDIIPVALLVGSLYYFWRKQYYLSFALNAIGFLSKGFPIVVIPFMALYLMRKGFYRILIKAGLLYLSIVFSPLLFFPGSAFLSSFFFQAERGVMGESFLNLFLAWFFGPQTYSYMSMQNQGIFTHWMMLLVLFPPILLIFLIFTWNLISKRLEGLDDYEAITIMYCCLVLFMFILFNRFYSPQFILWIFASIFIVLLFRHAERNVGPNYPMDCLVAIGICSLFNWILDERYYIYQKFFYWVFFIIVLIKAFCSRG